MMDSMNYEEFRRQLGKAGITAREFGEVLKLHPKSITNYSQQGEVPSHLAVIVTLMGEMAEHGMDYRGALSRIQIAPNKPRGGAMKGRFGGSKQIDLQLNGTSASEGEQQAVAHRRALVASDTAGGLKALSEVDWDFSDAKTNHVTHGVHPYPAKFIPQIPYKLIQELSNPGDTIGDIFCGSGTTLVEAVMLGRNAVGIDANPLACLITRAKTTAITTNQAAILQDISSKARALGDSLGRAETQSKTSRTFASDAWRPTFEKLTFWFPKHVIEELAEIRRWCDGLPDGATRDLGSTALSSIVVAVSRQDSDTRYVRREKNIHPGDTFKRFARALDQSIRQALEFGSLAHQDCSCNVVQGNLLDAPAIPQLDLMVCSPPYPNAYSYHLYHMTRMLWLGMDQPKFKREEIGSHRKYSSKGKNAATVETFEAEFAKILVWLSQNLKIGGYACFVVGDSTLRGQRINNADLISEAGRVAGFTEAARLSRNMQSTKKSFNPAIGKIKTEDILILENRGGTAR